MPNKIKYGIRSLYYAVATDDGTGNLSYATPVEMKGAVSLSLDESSENNIFYADDIAYFTSYSNNGYTGSLEVALIPDSFRKDVLGETEATGKFFEYANAPTIEFALLFEFQGDQSATRHALYRCIASRPAVSGQTKEANVTPQTETINLTVLPRIDDHLVKGRCNSTASDFANWFSAVVEP